LSFLLFIEEGSVADPHWFHGFNADPDMDPDPAFFVNARGSGSRSKVLKTKNLKKFIAEKKHIFLIKNAILLSLGLHKGRPGHRISLHPSK
jgi:hypothetical protein